MTKKYNIIYSLGRDCSCAMYMKQAKIRSLSGPFDWLTNADFKSRFDLMNKDFAGFLDIENLKQMEKPTAFPADKNNDYYENTQTGLYFWHDFPADIPFETAYPFVREKYDRRIKRFYEEIKNNQKVLLVWFSHLDQTPDEVVLACCNRFCDKMSKQIDFLIIEHTEGLNSPKCRNLAPNIIRWNMHTQKTDKNGAPTTLGNEKLVLPVFQQYGLIRPLSYYIRQWLIKAFCSVIPMKKCRQRIRKALSDRYLH